VIRGCPAMAAAAAAYFDEEDHDSSEIAILSDGWKRQNPYSPKHSKYNSGTRSPLFFSSSKFKKFEYKHLKNTMTKVMLHSFIL
jgi:hypothetical protein